MLRSHIIVLLVLCIQLVQAQQNATSTINTPISDNRSLNQSVSQSINQPINQSIDQSPMISSEFSSAFFASFSMILVSEIGDKTFFIAALMAMQNNQSIIFCAAMTALFLMTVFSSMLGLILPALIDPKLTQMVAIGLFVFFGIKMLIEAYQMNTNHLKDEMNEVEQELHERQLMIEVNQDVESSDQSMIKQPKISYMTYLLGGFVTPIFLQCLTMTFLAEWGDRSQIATIALSAARNPLVVIVGATLGHTICTGLAVVGGSLMASRINERTVSIVGGCLFLMFAAHAIVTQQS